MKHLLKHVQSQIQEELQNLSGSRQEIIYRDLLSKIEQAIEELGGATSNVPEGASGYDPSEPGGGSGSSHWDFYGEQIDLDEISDSIPDAFEGTKEEFANFAQHFKDLTGKEITDMKELSDDLFSEASRQKKKLESFLDDIRETAASASENPVPEDLRPDGEENLKDVEHTDEEKRAFVEKSQNDVPGNTHHAMRDGSKEDFDDLKENLESIGVDVDSLGNTTNVEDLSDEKLVEAALESVESINDVDSNLFRSIAQLAENKEHAAKVEDQTSDELVQWAVGNREFAVKRDTDKIAEKIQEILQEAKRSADGTVDMVNTLNQQIEEIAVSVNNDSQVETQVKTQDE